MIARFQPELQTSCPQMPGLGNRHDDFGCRVNAINVEELFQKYLDLNFLYEAKLNRLAPYLRTVKRNWQRAMDAGRTLFQVFTFEDKQTNAWASVVDWRSSNSGWWGQHLVSAGNPMASRAVMLSAQYAGIVRQDHHSEQNWFRPNNRMPKRVFGSIEAAVGTKNASVQEYQLLEVPLSNRTAAQTGYQLVKCDSSHTHQLVDFARAIKGDIYVQAEALDTGDLELKGVDRLYQQIGMRRYRNIWLNINRFGEVVAALIAYRGPLGLNFSFLENRADLLIAPDASDRVAEAAVKNLIAAASSEYSDFEPGYIPVIACDRGAKVLEAAGANGVRRYCHSQWVHEGYQAWYDHTDSFYNRIMERLARREKRTN